VVDQTGLVWIVLNGARVERPFLDIREKIVELNDLHDERGLLGLAFHPGFAENGRFYVSYSGHLRNDLSTAEWDHTTATNDPEPGCCLYYCSWLTKR
jgi:hypothetical protein